MTGEPINDESVCKEETVAYSRYHLGICLEGLRETVEHLVSRCPGRDSNRAPPEYRFRALKLDQPVSGPHSFYMFHPPYPLRFHFRNNIFWKVRIMKLLFLSLSFTKIAMLSSTCRYRAISLCEVILSTAF
jgi:hypothetical protein